MAMALIWAEAKPTCSCRSKMRDQICSAVFIVLPTHMPIHASHQPNSQANQNNVKPAESQPAAARLVMPLPSLLLFQFIKLTSADGPDCRCFSFSFSATPMSRGHPACDSSAVPSRCALQPHPGTQGSEGSGFPSFLLPLGSAL